MPKNMKKVVSKCREILHNLGDVSDTRYLLKALKNANIDTGGLNEYSLKALLSEQKGFFGLRKFEITLQRDSSEKQRKTLAEIIFDIVDAADKPITALEIKKHLDNQRGLPTHAITQCVSHNQNIFLHIEKGKWWTPRHIEHYGKKTEAIIGFSKKWLHSKGKPLSTFLISEVLKETTSFKDLHIGLVENVLSSCSSFKRVRNGFFDLMKAS